MKRAIWLCVLIPAACMSNQLDAEEGEFVIDGVPMDVRTVGHAWTETDGALVCSGQGSILNAGKRIAAGDFVVQVRMAISKLQKSAASLVINDSHFGFEGSTGKMFTHGSLFGSVDLGEPVVSEGKPFQLVVRREGDQLTVEIDSEIVHTTKLDSETVVRVGLRPWRSTMHLVSFTADGALLDAPKPLPHVDVFKSDTEGYHTYRIPAIVLTKKGTLLAFCEGRKSGRGDAGNIDMLVRRSIDQGKTWSKFAVIWDDQGNTCGNPCPVVDQDTGTIWLAMTWNLGSDHERDIMTGTSADARHAYITRSADDGQTWSKPIKISEQVRLPHWRWYATGPGNAIQLTRGAHKGRLLIPANHSDHSDPQKHPYRSHVFWSDDHGKSWRLGGILDERTNESAAVELVDGSVLLSMRSYHGKHNRAGAISRDGGESFGEVSLHDALQTPVCQANILRYSWPDVGSDGKSRILFCSPAGVGRTELTVCLSYDDGKTWPVNKLIYEGGAAYSNMIVLQDGRIGVLYEKDDYRTISFVTFPIQWLEK